VSGLSPYFVAAFPGRILNIHPSLLPAFPGLEAQRRSASKELDRLRDTITILDNEIAARRHLQDAMERLQRMYPTNETMKFIYEA